MLSVEECKQLAGRVSATVSVSDWVNT